MVDVNLVSQDGYLKKHIKKLELNDGVKSISNPE